MMLVSVAICHVYVWWRYFNGTILKPTPYGYRSFTFTR
jgi:hypothetical protein